MEVNKSPLISVCIPTHNGAEHLAAAIDSVLAQKLGDFELIIIDDHSCDNTAEVARSYDDPRIRFLANPNNIGAQENWNRCLAESRGRYFKLLPQDDLIAPECLATQAAVLEEDKAQNIALVCCARNIVNADGRPLMRRGFSRLISGKVDAELLIRLCLRHGTNLIGEPGSVLFRRELAQRVGHFDASIPYVVDLDYWFRLLKHGNAWFLRERLASFRLSRGSWSVAIGGSQGMQFRRFMHKIARDPCYATRKLDLLAGSLMTHINNLLRLAFYRILLR